MVSTLVRAPLYGHAWAIKPDQKLRDNFKRTAVATNLPASSSSPKRPDMSSSHCTGHPRSVASLPIHTRLNRPPPSHPISTLAPFPAPLPLLASPGGRFAPPPALARSPFPPPKEPPEANSPLSGPPPAPIRPARSLSPLGGPDTPSPPPGDGPGPPSCLPFDKSPRVLKKVVGCASGWGGIRRVS